MTEPEEQKKGGFAFWNRKGCAGLNDMLRTSRAARLHSNGLLKMKLFSTSTMRWNFCTHIHGAKKHTFTKSRKSLASLRHLPMKNCIREALGEQAEIIRLEHFLQEGYTEALARTHCVHEGRQSACRLPDSTCLIVIEKKKGMAERDERMRPQRFYTLFGMRSQLMWKGRNESGDSRNRRSGMRLRLQSAP